MLGLPDGVVACLFDLDGVLTDTASVHEAAWKQVFDEVLDQPFTHEDYETYVDGKTREDGTRSMLQSRGMSLDLAPGIAAKKNEVVLATLRRDGVKVYEGSRRYLQACADAGVRRAVVSSSANTPTVLEVTGLGVLIEQVVAGRHDLKGKPAPDTFLEGARLLGMEPEQCAVFEDALAGVEAGRAGAFGHVVGVDRVGHGAELLKHGAHVVVTDLAELL
ncbi:MAG: hypothetical protein JWO12_1868 [Frankiales bacterium]|nr:hypothetical protein [Frankiales bacterium]